MTNKKILKKQIIYRSTHRGSKEMDLLLGNFVKKYVDEFDIKIENDKEDPDKRDYIVSNEKIESHGWKPDYSLDDGIKELIKGYGIIRPNRFANV